MGRERSAEEVAGAARRMIRALGRRVGECDPVDLHLIADLRAEVEAAFLAAMREQHAGTGFSYAEIAAGLGTSRQAIAKRLGPASTDVA